MSSCAACKWSQCGPYTAAVQAQPVTHHLAGLIVQIRWVCRLIAWWGLQGLLLLGGSRGLCPHPCLAAAIHAMWARYRRVAQTFLPQLLVCARHCKNAEYGRAARVQWLSKRQRWLYPGTRQSLLSQLDFGCDAEQQMFTVGPRHWPSLLPHSPRGGSQARRVEGGGSWGCMGAGSLINLA